MRTDILVGTAVMGQGVLVLN